MLPSSMVCVASIGKDVVSLPWRCEKAISRVFWDTRQHLRLSFLEGGNIVTFMLGNVDHGVVLGLYKETGALLRS
jgi:hypothetical protein